MELIFGVVADAANIGEGNKINILGIFENINTNRLPCAVPHMALVFSLRAGVYAKGKTFNVSIPFVDPDGKILFTIESTLNISDGPDLEPVAPLALNLHHVAIAKSGPHKFEVQVDGEVCGDIRLNVNLVKDDHSGE